MRRTKCVAATVLAGAVVFIAGWRSVHGQGKGDKKPISSKEMKEIMVRVHKGDASPLTDLHKQLAAASPDWTQVGKDVKAVSEMAEGLRTGNYHSPYVYSSTPDEYVASARALEKAVAEMDRKAAAAALNGLHASCVSCHGYRNPLK